MLKLKVMKKKAEIYYFSSLILFFFGGILLNFKLAYDYTLIKNLFGLLFCLLISIYFIFTKKEFVFTNSSFPAIFFYTWILISSFYAPFKYGAGKLLENYILYFLIFIISSNIEMKKEYLYLWIVAGTIASIIGIFQFCGPRHYAISTFGNPNFYAGHILMPLCLSFANILNWEEYQNKFLKYFDILLLIFGIWCLILTDSKAAQFALIFGFSFIWYLKNFERKGMLKFAGFFFIFFVLLILYPKITVWFKENIRYYIWPGTIKMIIKKPILGWGFGNFIFFYPYFRKREYFLRPESTPVTNHPHNEFLELWAEIGLIGLCLFIFLILFSIIRIIKKRNSLNIACSGGVISVLFDNIFSTNLRNPSTSMFFWFLIGLISNKETNGEKIDFTFSKFLWNSIILASFILFIFHSTYRILPQVYFKNGEKWKELKVYDESIKNYTIACNLDPYNYEVFYKLAFVYGQIKDYKKSEMIYLYINKYLFPHFAKTDANLGTVYVHLGDFKKALSYYKIAEWFNPYDEDVLCSIASIYLLYYNNIEKAKNYLEKVLRINPKNNYANRVLFILKKKGEIK